VQVSLAHHSQVSAWELKDPQTQVTESPTLGSLRPPRASTTPHAHPRARQGHFHGSPVRVTRERPIRQLPGALGQHLGRGRRHACSSLSGRRASAERSQPISAQRMEAREAYVTRRARASSAQRAHAQGTAPVVRECERARLSNPVGVGAELYILLCLHIRLYMSEHAWLGLLCRDGCAWMSCAYYTCAVEVAFSILFSLRQFFFFKLGYIRCIDPFIVTISSRLILYIG
jgi:hypothetical protein